MSDETALLHAICEHPDEDTPRLVYADWLDEHDRPERAEFIRVQCERARGLGDREHRTNLLKRSMQLIQEFGQRWFTQDWPDAGNDAVTGYTFERGFVDLVSMARRGLRDADIARILESRPLIALVRVWNISQNWVGDDGLRAIANCPRLARLYHLVLSANPVTLQGIEALAASRHLTSLAEVTVSHFITATDIGMVQQLLEAQVRAQEMQAVFQRYGKAVRVRT